MKNIIGYTSGLRSPRTSATPEANIGLLEYMQEKLCFAGIELQRMENEGGIPLDDMQAAEVDAYFKVERCIRQSIADSPVYVAPRPVRPPLFVTIH